MEVGVADDLVGGPHADGNTRDQWMPQREGDRGLRQRDTVPLRDIGERVGAADVSSTGAAW